MRSIRSYVSLTRYAKLRVAHAPGIPGTFSPPPQVGDSDMQRDTCITHVPRSLPGSLTSGFLRNRWRGKPHSQRMRNPQFCVSGKSFMLENSWKLVWVVTHGGRGRQLVCPPLHKAAVCRDLRAKP